jgi:hypothetical protein
MKAVLLSLLLACSSACAAVEEFSLNKPMTVQFFACLDARAPIAAHVLVADGKMDEAREFVAKLIDEGRCGTLVMEVKFTRQVHVIDGPKGPLAVYEAVLQPGTGLDGAVVYVPMENMLHIPVRL